MFTDIITMALPSLVQFTSVPTKQDMGHIFMVKSNKTLTTGNKIGRCYNEFYEYFDHTQMWLLQNIQYVHSNHKTLPQNKIQMH